MANHLRCLAVTLILLVALPVAAQGRRPVRPHWLNLYLQAIELEHQQRWLGAADRLRRALRLQPEPRRQVPLGDGGTVDYAPYTHLAHVMARAGAPRPVVEPLLARAKEAGVAPAEKLALLEELLQALPQRAPGRRGRTAQGGRPQVGAGDAGPRATRPPQSPAPTVASEPVVAPTSPPAPATVALPEGIPAGIVLRIDGHDLPAETRRAEVPPGPHRVAAVQDGAVLLERTVVLQPGQLLTLLPVEAPTPTATPTVPLPPELQRVERVEETVLAWVIRILPVVSVLALVVILVRARRRASASPGAGEAPTLPSPEPVRPVAAPRVPTSLTGTSIEGYRLGDRLGSGGMATTYRAERLSDGREVAVKIPHEHCLEDSASRERFLREGRLGEQLHHPNIVRVLEAGEVDGWPFLAMELVHGRTLRELLRAARPLPLERTLEVVRQVAEALDYAHAKGVIHRDLKPENLMIEPGGRVRVMDFGIARVQSGTALTATSMFVGTPLYAAPEGIEGGEVDGRADLYALGIILFEMLEGAAPFADATPLEQLRRHLDGDFPDREDLERSLPDPIWALLERLTARDPDARFQSAQALLVHLRDLQRAVEEGWLGG